MTSALKPPEIHKEPNGDISVVSGPAQFQAWVDSGGRFSLVLNDGDGAFDSEAGVAEAGIELDGPTLDAVILALQELRTRIK